MATVQELSVFTADIRTPRTAPGGVTFHQFIQSLEKSVLQRPSADHSNDFQLLYTELKEISRA